MSLLSKEITKQKMQSFNDDKLPAQTIGSPILITESNFLEFLKTKIRKE